MAAALDATATGPDATPLRRGPDDPLAENLRHCPTAVEGARSQIVDVNGGIAFEITATEPDATAEIRRRAAHLVELTAGRSKRGEHGGGAGGGTMRNCPVVVSKTAIAAQETYGGSRITVMPTGDYSADELRVETRKRYAAYVSP